MEPIQIPLGRTGLVALIDADDFERVGQWRWYTKRDKGSACERIYAAARLETPHGWRKVTLHRYIMDAQPGELVDHINHDGLDNRRANLRLATTRQNSANSPPGRRNKTGYKGVVYSKGSWYANVTVDARTRLSGPFGSPELAALAHDRLAKELFGDFAYQNFGAGTQLSLTDQPAPLTLF